ncbi:glutamate receptor ionotropic, delta-2-like [Panulirus ornatus]|uniref:glutamate receptor ionotropic, delta-2-like n=1 Tax=Panulirus ornatus TaxID=150431 RepID=UPI003A8581E3
MYSGTLTAALTVTAYEKPIDSLYQLAQAHQDGFIIGTTRDTNLETAFKNAKSGIYHEVWQLFNHEDRDQSFLPNPETAFETILQQKYVFIDAQLNSKLKAAQLGPENFYFARQTFLPQGYGIVCTSGSLFRDVFSRILVRLTEVGLMTKWENEEVNKVSRYMSTSNRSGPTAIRLQHLQASTQYICDVVIKISVSEVKVDISLCSVLHITAGLCYMHDSSWDGKHDHQLVAEHQHSLRRPTGEKDRPNGSLMTKGNTNVDESDSAHTQQYCHTWFIS